MRRHHHKRVREQMDIRFAQPEEDAIELVPAVLAQRQFANRDWLAAHAQEDVWGILLPHQCDAAFH